MNRTCLFGLLTAFTVGSAALAAEDRRVPSQYPTIQSAIDAAEAGDRVLVAPGTYLEAIDFDGKAITVRGTAGAAATILDAGGRDRPAVIMNSPDGAALEGVLVRHGSGANGGGLFLVGRGEITNVTFTGNQADLGGGAFVAGDAVFTNCVFSANTARLGGGLYTGLMGSATIDGSEFTDNQAGQGGAIFASPLSFGGSPVSVDTTDFERNAADTAGGAAFACDRDMVVTASRFADNRAARGAALFLALDGTILSDGSEFVTNTAQSSGGAGLNTGPSRDALVILGGLVCDNAPDGFSGPHRMQDAETECAPDGNACAVDLAEPFGTLNTSDIITFVSFFNARDSRADFDGNGVISSMDISVYIRGYYTGCN